MNDRRFKYTSSPILLVVSLILVGGSCAFFVFMLATGTQLELNGIDLGSDGSFYAWAILAAVSGLVVAMIAWVAALPLFFDRSIVITDHSLSVPGLLHAPSPILIPLDEVSRVEEVIVSGQRQLRVSHRGGHTDIAALLLTDEAIEAILDLDPGWRPRTRR